MTFGIIVFALVITASIALHEFGHLLTAKWFGMKATRYFVGFGPTLWSFRRGETEYGVKAIPAGGFVKIIGMTPLEDVDPGDEPRAFHRQPAEQRAVVLAAGSFMHFVLAFAVLLGIVWFVGVPGGASTTVQSVSPCATVDPTPADGSCPAGVPASAAARAGIKPGDRIVSFDGVPVDDWSEDFAGRVRARDTGPAPLVVERDGRLLELTVNVDRITRTDPETNKQVETGFVGLGPEQEIVRYGPIEGFGMAGEGMARAVQLTARAIVDIPAQLPDLVRQATGNTERTGEGPASVIGAARIAGQASQAANISAFLQLVVGINIFVGMFNLLPLLPLDGGHLAVLWFEEFRAAIARRLKRPVPGKVDLNKLMPATYAFLLLIITLQVLVLYADIANPIPDPFRRG